MVTLTESKMLFSVAHTEDATVRQLPDGNFLYQVEWANGDIHQEPISFESAKSLALEQIAKDEMHPAGLRKAQEAGLLAGSIQ
jgi:hypothetical protein